VFLKNTHWSVFTNTFRKIDEKNNADLGIKKAAPQGSFKN